MSENKGKLAIYWAASCGGCEISILALNEKILDVTAAFDIVFCPCIMDTKARDIEKTPDNLSRNIQLIRWRPCPLLLF